MSNTTPTPSGAAAAAPSAPTTMGASLASPNGVAAPPVALGVSANTANAAPGTSGVNPWASDATTTSGKPPALLRTPSLGRTLSTAPSVGGALGDETKSYSSASAGASGASGARDR